MSAFLHVFSSGLGIVFAITLIVIIAIITFRIAPGITSVTKSTRFLGITGSLLSFFILTACTASPPTDVTDTPDDGNHYTDEGNYVGGNDYTDGNAYTGHPGDNLIVHYIDIGQGDSTLILLPDRQTILIDAGKNSDGEFIVNYIKGLNVTKIDYLIATHPDADHTGGLDTVINLLEIGRIYMPDITSNTRTFEDVLTAIENKGLSIYMAQANETLIEDENLKAVFLAPVAKIKDTNDMSAVLHITYGNTTFLFTGDAEYKSEKRMLESGFNIKADVLKAGHHGSKSSSSKEFVKAVSPKYAVISCGAENSYGHPAAETLAVFKEMGAEILRTDEMGTIVAVSDGVNITFNKHSDENQANSPPTTENIGSQANTQPQQGDTPLQQDSVQIQPESSPLAEPQTISVFVTKTGTSYHIEGCRYLSKSQIPISLEQAASQYTPCSACNPPQ